MTQSKSVGQKRGGRQKVRMGMRASDQKRRKRKRVEYLLKYTRN